MSLIEEALRRIQQPLPAEQNPRTASAPSEPSRGAHSWSATPPTPSPRSSPIRLPLLLVATSTIGLTAVLMVGGAFWLGHAVRLSSPASPRVTVSPQPLPALPTPVPPLAEPVLPSGVKSQRPSNQLVLSGIVEGLGDPYAVINGLILGVGEHIGGSTLLSIGHGVVKVRRADGSEEVLRVQR